MVTEAMQGGVEAGWPFTAPAQGRSRDLQPPAPLYAELQEQGTVGAAAAALPCAPLPHRLAAPPADGRAVPRGLVEEALGALLRDGAVVLTGAAPPSVCAALVRDVSGAARHRTGQCVSGIPAHSTASHALLADPRVMVLCEGVLGSQVLRLNQGELEHLFTDAHNPPQRDRRPLQMPWELHVSRAAPGSAAVAPHAAWHRAGHGGPQCITVLERLDLQLDCLWCLDAAAGAASVEIRLPLSGGAPLPVQLGQGDVLLLRDSVQRRAVPGTHGWLLCAGYQLGLLDAEENLISQCPPSVARTFPQHLQRLVGYAQPSVPRQHLYSPCHLPIKRRI